MPGRAREVGTVQSRLISKFLEFRHTFLRSYLK